MKPRLVGPRRPPLPTVYAVGMVKDEEDIIATTVLNLLGWGVDRVIVADNDSTDSTGDILAKLAHATQRVTVIRDHEEAYYQARKMTALANYAGDLGAEWVVPFDADEVWYPTGGLGASIPSTLAAVDPQALWVEVGMANHYCTGQDIGATSWPPPQRMVWRHNEPNPLAKVAFRWRPGVVLGMGNHDVTFPSDYEGVVGEAQLLIRHFPYRSPDQFVRKARNGSAAYAATDLDPMYGDHWRNYGRILDVEGEEALRGVFWEHFYYDDPEGSMTLDPAPVAPGLWLA